MVGGRGKKRQVIFPRSKLTRLPGVGKGQCVQLRVAKHFLVGGVIEGAVNRGVEGARVS